MGPFGGPVLLHEGDAADMLSASTAPEDIARPHAMLSALDGESPGSLRLYRPHRTAAFAPRDTALEAYPSAALAMRQLGFAPTERRAGGQLAIYDSHALVIDLVAPHEEPRNDVKARFQLFAQAIAGACRRFQVDARIGQVAGEYCPGDYSVNAGGTHKLAGLAQRIGRRGYHLGAVISVEPSPEAEEAVDLAYSLLGFPFTQASFGALTMVAPQVTFPGLGTALFEELSRLVGVVRTTHPAVWT